MTTPSFQILAVHKNGLTFIDVAHECIRTPELVSEFDRLNKTNILGKGSALEKMIDESCGRLDHDLTLFLNFVWECVFTRLPV